MSGPELIVTADLDWASEACIARFCEDMIGRGITPLLFATHRSAVVADLLGRGLVEVGIHPNFFPGSDQGAGYAEVVDFLLGLYPDARISRSHSYFDNSRVAAVLKSRGISFDSNACLIGQPGIAPIDHWTGIRRFPVFWEDDIHWTLGGGWDFAGHAASFLTPGLKIVDVHPINYAFNVDGQAAYDSIRHLTRDATAADIRAHRLGGPGVSDFVLALLDRFRADGAKIGTMAALIGRDGGHAPR